MTSLAPEVTALQVTVPPAPPGDAPGLGGLAVLGLGRGPHGNIHAQHSRQKEYPPSRGGTDSKTGGSASAASATGATGATALLESPGDGGGGKTPRKVPLTETT